MFLDPLLQYLSSVLPPPLYYFLVSSISHSIATLSTVVSLSKSLLSQHPSDWNAQTLLPPILAILTAYLALASLYRTITWGLRLTFFFIKWGIILAIVFAGLGYIMGPGGGDGLWDPSTTATRNCDPSLPGCARRDNVQSKQPRKPPVVKSRPKPWESFQVHQEWQYQAESPQRKQKEQAGGNPVFSLAMNAAQYVMTDQGEWWKSFKDMVGGDVESSDAQKTQRPQQKSRAAGSRSR